MGRHLSAIENQGKEKLDMTNLSIEHVLPQNSNLSTAWQRMLGCDWRNVRDKYLHTLGNLTLTGYNSELGDRPFPEKKQMLSDAQSKMVVLNQDIMDADVWDETAILKRADHLSNIIIMLFPIKQPDVSVSFSDPRYHEYSCEDANTATFKAPNYFIFQGEHVNCPTFAEMLKLVNARLYNIDPSIIKNMARADENFSEHAQRTLFSYDKEEVDGEYKIPGTDIYENVGFSAYHVMSIIKEMLDRYDIDHTDFVYSARSTNTNSKSDTLE